MRYFTQNETKFKMLIVFLIVLVATNLYSQQPAIEWEINLGGSNTDVARDIQQTIDGGYIVAGYSNSTNGDVGGNNGSSDFWVLKLDVTGNLLWETNLGGSDSEWAEDIQQTSDGGYIVAGYSWSNDGDVGGNNGLSDFWIVKLDATGNLLWETNLGGNGFDEANDIQQTTDGGYIVAGQSESSDGDVGGNNGNKDYWIVKLDTTGNLLWETNLGGSSNEWAESIQQTTDGGYIVAGISISADGDVGGNNGESDSWIVKLDINGTLVWETNLGGSDHDSAGSIQQTIDGGYIVAGHSSSNNGDVGGNNGNPDYWIVKLDTNGTLVWETNLGGSDWEIAYSTQQTADGGYIVAGYSSSIDGDVGGNNGSSDFWIVKLGASLGVEDNFSSKNINLYPNPTTNNITIVLGKTYQKIEVSITNSLGQQLLTTTKTNKDKIVVKLNASSGLYYCTIILDEKIKTTLKVIKN